MERGTGGEVKGTELITHPFNQFNPLTESNMKPQTKIEIENQIRTLRDALQDVLEISAVYHTKREIFIQGRIYSDLYSLNAYPDWKRIITDRLSSLGFSVNFEENENQVVLHIIRPGYKSGEVFPWTNLVLFFLTVLTTLAAGAMMEGKNIFSDPFLILKGWSFAVPLLSILLCHEFGHYIESRINGIKVSLPYFIPGPTILGTFGAVIRSKSPFKNRKNLLDVGAAGPIAGFVVAVIVVILGLSYSQVVAKVPQGGISLGDSLIFKLLSFLVLKKIPEGHDVLLSPTAFAGWAGILVTMLNLLPIGQLDGGHIIYALLGKMQKKIALVAVLVLIPLGIFLWEGWLVWVVLILIIKLGHPPTLNDQIPLDFKRKIIGWTAMFIFILSFTPVPIK
jgi:membrane-associated protease RseP (regulator of RpoE activity)